MNAEPKTLESALDAGDWDSIEELWLERLDDDPIPTERLLEVRRRLWKEGEKTLALTLLELLADALELNGQDEDALVAVSELVRLTDKPGEGLRSRLAAALRRARADTAEVDAVLSHYDLSSSRRPLDALADVETWLAHAPGTAVEVVGQGVGRVTEINLELGNIKVDIGGGRPLSIPFGASAKFLNVLPKGSFLRQKVDDPEAVAAAVEADPGAALAHLLEGFDEPADVASIKSALEGVLAPSAWSSWWSKARKHPRIVTSGTGSRLRYSVTASAADATAVLLDEMRSESGRARLQAAKRIADRGDDAAAAVVAEIARSASEALDQSDPGLAWECAATLADLPGGREAAAEIREHVLDATEPRALLRAIEDRSAREEALDALFVRFRDDWPQVWSEAMLVEESPSLLQRLADDLASEGHEDRLDQALETIFRSPTDHAGRFVWACEAMVRDDAPEALRARMTPSLLERIPDTLTRREFADLRARAKQLLDRGQVAIRILLESASPEQAQRFSSRIARIDTVEPARQALIDRAVQQTTGPPTESEPLFVATPHALEAKQSELKQLLEIEIPKTLKGINAAAAEGDLRENFEYHMLRDRQELLSAKAAKLQRELARVRVLQPGTADASKVSVGTVVELAGDDGEPLPPITILGPWDADPSERVFADGTELAQGLLGHSEGDTVEVEGTSATITSIRPWE